MGEGGVQSLVGRFEVALQKRGGQIEGDVHVVEPGGFAYDTSNRLYSDNTFSAEIVREPTARGGSVAALADDLTPQAEMLTLASGSLYVTSYVISPTDENPDVIYKINTISGAITNFITSHIWGPYQMIFAKVTKSR